MYSRYYNLGTLLFLKFGDILDNIKGQRSNNSVIPILPFPAWKSLKNIHDFHLLRDESVENSCLLSILIHRLEDLKSNQPVKDLKQDTVGAKSFHGSKNN